MLSSVLAVLTVFHLCSAPVFTLSHHGGRVSNTIFTEGVPQPERSPANRNFCDGGGGGGGGIYPISNVIEHLQTWKISFNQHDAQLNPVCELKCAEETSDFHRVVYLQRIKAKHNLMLAKFFFLLSIKRKTLSEAKSDKKNLMFRSLHH